MPRIIKESGIKVRRIKTGTDTPLCEKDVLCDPLCNLAHGSLILACGGAQSGKTNLMLNLLSEDLPNPEFKKTNFKYLFNNLYFVSPTAHSIKADVINEIGNECKYTDLEEFLDDYDNIIVPKAIEDMDNETQLIIIDDFGPILKNKEIKNRLINMIMLRRHYNTTIVLLCQTLGQLATDIESSISLFISFCPQSRPDREKLMDLLGKRRKFMEEIYNFVFDESHSFLIIDRTKKKSGKNRYFKNFDEMEL